MSSGGPNNHVDAFLKTAKCLLVEPSSAFLTNIASCLTLLGAKKENILLAIRIEDAMALAEQHRPNLIITEHQIADKFGLDLIERVDQLVGELNRVAILATRNSSDTAVAEAAEEQIDAYILKPFSMGEFQEKLQDTIMRKMHPSDYLRHIQSGKILLEKNEPSAAIMQFDKAKKLSTKPSLAHYYLGLIKQSDKNLEQAVLEYNEGLKYTPLHYRCLTGEFDVLFQQQKYKAAYQLVGDIKKNYPISPKRLGQIMISAIYSNRMADLPEYFKLFNNITNRSTELITITTASFKTAGKAMLKENNPEKAVSFFEMGALASQLDPDYLDSVVRELLKFHLPDQANDLYRKFPRTFQLTDRYLMLGFLIDCQMLDEGGAFDRGRKVLSTITQGDPDFYREMVRLAAALGKKTTAEDIINKAVTQFPELRKELYSIIGE